MESGDRFANRAQLIWWYLGGTLVPFTSLPVTQIEFKNGADGRIRTGDPLFTKQLLCQLSYVGVRTDYMSGLVPQ